MKFDIELLKRGHVISYRCPSNVHTNGVMFLVVNVERLTFGTSVDLIDMCNCECYEKRTNFVKRFVFNHQVDYNSIVKIIDWLTTD